MKQKKPASRGRCRIKLILTIMENSIPTNILGLKYNIIHILFQYEVFKAYKADESCSKKIPNLEELGI
jgi:hypothetical protein